MLARLARVLLVVALLAGWQDALLHPLEHFDQHGGLVHLADSHSHERDSNGSGALCDALAALTACAPDAPLVFDFPAPQQQSSFSFKTERRAAEAPPFLAQGPPALL